MAVLNRDGVAGAATHPPAVQLNIIGRDGSIGRPLLLAASRNALTEQRVSPPVPITSVGYRYNVKIIDSEKPVSQAITRQLHRYTRKFDCITSIKVQLMEKFSSNVPDTINFNIGYFEGRQSKKRWLCCQDDLDSMYSFFKPGSEITLWCEAKKTSPKEQEQPKTRKRKQDMSMTKRQEKEEEVDDTYKELKEKHGDQHDNLKLRLWARMIASGLHDSLEEPPDVPAFQRKEAKKKRESVAGAISGAAEALMKFVDKQSPAPAVNPETLANSEASTCSSRSVGISPAKAADLRMKNLEQLRYLQGLYEDDILTDNELVEQKRAILNAIRKLS